MSSESWNSFLLFEISLDSLQRTPIQTNCNLALAPAFSPRGDYLAWACVDRFSSVSVNVQRLKDGRVTQLLRQPNAIDGIGWSTDGSRIVFSSEGQFGSLWEIDLNHSNILGRLPVGHDVSDVAVSPANSGLAFVQNRRNVNIWHLDLTGPQLRSVRAVTSSREEIAPDISPDGAHITFESNRSGNNEVWMSNADGSNPVQLSSFGIQMTGTPRWSPDGKFIAFDSRVEGEANIYIVDPHEGVPRKLDIDIRGNNLPNWSHDGKWIYFENGEDSQHATVWKVPTTGGHAIQLVGQEAIQPTESPDGKYVYFVRHLSLWRVQPDGGAAEPVSGMPQLSGGGDAWFPTGSGIYYLSLNSKTKKAEIKFFDLKSRTTRVIYVMEKNPPWAYVGGLPVSSDGKWLLFPQVDEQSSDLMLIENWH
jgi:Tol biopolymer transport system component